MGLETPNAGPLPYDVFIGRGWEPPGFRMVHQAAGSDVVESDDLSDVTAVRLGLTRKGSPRVQYVLTDEDGVLELDFYPLNGAEATGSEPPNAILVRLPPSGNEGWVEGRYAFDIALTRGDGAINTVVEGLLEVRIPA